MTLQRPAEAGELCICGRKATVVFQTEAHGEVGWCGLADRGRRGRCTFCSAPAGHRDGAVCPSYSLVSPAHAGPAIDL
jgi:hypothetical protein